MFVNGLERTWSVEDNEDGRDDKNGSGVEDGEDSKDG